MAKEYIENVPFDELRVGRKASLTRTLSQEDALVTAVISGSVSPDNVEEAYAKPIHFGDVVGHGMWVGALVSTVLGRILPGPGTTYLEQDLKYASPLKLGDEITATITVASKGTGTPLVVFNCACYNQRGETVATGKATVLAPREKIRHQVEEAPMLTAGRQTDGFQTIWERNKDHLQPIRTAVVHPLSSASLQAASEAAEEGLIIPILIGPVAKIKELAEKSKIDLHDWEMIDVAHSHAAAALGASMAAEGKVDALMKGSLHSDEILGAVVSSSSGLRTEHRISHAFVMDVSSYHKPIIVTDAAINIAPDLTTKADICQNAINLWKVMFGFDEKPKVAVLSAVETVTGRMQSTLDAAALCKMSDRGQIQGAILDGPLAFDNAISVQAAKDKGITSEVAGDADILLVPNIEAGNMLAKELSFLGHADAAGIVLGARVPVILTSRADSVRSRLLSCGLACLMAKARKDGKLPS
jgi:phosphate acetyltransferase